LEIFDFFIKEEFIGKRLEIECGFPIVFLSHLNILNDMSFDDGAFVRDMFDERAIDGDVIIFVTRETIHFQSSEITINIHIIFQKTI